MTVSSTTNRKTFSGDGVTVAFGTSPVIFFTSADLSVYVITAAGVATLKTLTTHYTVSGGAGLVGTVTMLTAPASGETLLVVRDIDILQDADFVNNDSSDAEVAEDAIDKLTMIAQQLSTRIDRSFALADSDVSGASTVIPTPAASSLVGWNSGATALQNYAAATLSTALTTPFSLTLLDDVNATAARTTLDVSQAIHSLTAETLPDIADEIAMYDTSEGADNKITLANLWKLPSTLTADTDPDRDNDYVATYDASAAAAKKMPIKASKIAVAVRQCVLAAALDSSGYNAAITTGSGLRPGLDASPTAMVLTFANGFDEYGAVDYATKLSADVADPLGADAKLSNTTFMHATYVSPTSVTWGSCLVPPQHGYTFDRTKQALLNFEGSNGATTTTDDFGNTWTLTNATISTAQFKFGASSLSIAAAGQFAESANFTSLGDGSWELAAWVRPTAVPAGAVVYPVFALENAAGFGAILALYGNAGVPKFSVYLSGDAATNSIANNTLGTTTIANATWYRVRLVFDALAGNYKVYLSNNGAAETLELTVASTVRISAVTKFRIGRSAQGGFTDLGTGAAFVDAFRFLPCATNTSTETPGGAAPTITDYPVHFFSQPEMKMYEVTAASGVAGTNPTLTQRNRVFTAEFDTSGAAVTAVRNYQLRGEFEGAWTNAPASATLATVTHNIGVLPRNVRMEARNTAAFAGYNNFGDVFDIAGQSSEDGTPSSGTWFKTRLAFGFIYLSQVIVGNKANGNRSGLQNVAAGGAIQYRFVANRGW